MKFLISIEEYHGKIHIWFSKITELSVVIGSGGGGSGSGGGDGSGGGGSIYVELSTGTSFLQLEIKKKMIRANTFNNEFFFIKKIMIVR